MFNRGKFNRTSFNRASSGDIFLKGSVKSRSVTHAVLRGELALRGRTSARTRFYVLTMKMSMRLRTKSEYTQTRAKATLGIEHIETLQRAMNAAVRDIKAMVEITYTDPFNDYSLEFSTNQQAYNSNLPDVADSIVAPRYKWFNLSDNKLDGSFHPIDVNHSRMHSVGWWGTTLSDANGFFSTVPKLTIEFSPRAMLSFSAAGDELLENYPVDFSITAFNAAGQALHTETVTNNTLYHWSKNIPQIFEVTKIELTVTRINRAGQPVRITEFFTTIREVYEDESIVSIDLLEEIGYSSGSLPIGNISANEVDITLNNFDRRFDLTNTGSTLYGYVKRNRQVRVWIGAEVYGKIEWAPLGTFWTTQWDIRKDSLTATLVARDRLELMRRTDFDKAPLYLNRSLHYLFQQVLTHAGLAPEEYVLDPQLQNVVIPIAWFTKMSHRDALQRLASCAIVQVYCTKDNKIAVDYGLEATPDVKAVMDDDVNVLSATYPLAVAEQVNAVEVTRTIWELNEGDATTSNIPIYESKETVTVPPGISVQSFQFTKVPVQSLAPPTIVGDSKGVTMPNLKAYAYGIDITFNNPTGATVVLDGITMVGRVYENKGTELFIAEDPGLIQEDGRIAQTLSHDFIQDRTYSQALATEILNTFKDSRYDVVLETRGDVTINLSDRMAVLDEHTQTDYMVARQQIRWDGSLSATVDGKRL